MVQITEKEKEILAEWISGVDLSKVKIRAGPKIDKICSLLGAQAITIGHTIFTSSKSWITRYPAGHPARLALLAHEVFHVKQESDKGLARYMLQYLAIEIWLILKEAAMITKHCFSPAKLANFIGKHHPYEKPAYKLQAEFLERHWAKEEAKKWKGVSPK